MNFRELIERNIYVSEALKSTIGKSFNTRMLNWIDQYSTIDTIDSFTDFKVALNDLPYIPPGYTYAFKNSYSENTMYGYAQALMKYANIPLKELFYLPLLQHGITVDGYLSGHINRPYIFQGKYLKDVWNDRKNPPPIYFVGPYIHYANCSWENKKITERHNSNGKTLLIFPAHSNEIDKLTVKKNDFLDVALNKIGKQYDTIMACVYWANMNDQTTDFLEKNGVKLVSAGFKTDPRFVERLKTIIKLSDATLFPSLVTSIGYAYYLDKKVMVYDDSINLDYSGDVSLKINSELKIFSKKLANCFPIDNIDNNSEQFRFVDKYWGISEVKTKEEICSIFNKNKEYIRKRKGF